MATASGQLMNSEMYKQMCKHMLRMEKARKGFPPLEAFKRMSEAGKMAVVFCAAISFVGCVLSSPVALLGLISLWELSDSWELVGGFWHDRWDTSSGTSSETITIMAGQEDDV